MKNKDLEIYLNTMMNAPAFADYAPNGLQIEGMENIDHILTSPSISLSVIEKAVNLGAQAILVHHGLFWENETRIISGPYKEKLKRILNHDINLFAYHLPLDSLSDYGNNAPVLRALKMTEITPFENIGYSGKFDNPIDSEIFIRLLNTYFQTSGQHLRKEGPIQKVAIVSGNGVSYLKKAIEYGMDAFITGESSEWVYTLSKENNIAFSAMGHYKSECIGVKLLGEHLQNKLKIKVDFFSEDNPF